MYDATEAADAELVDEGCTALLDGDIERAEELFRDVITRVPADYENTYTDDVTTAIKFWDQNDFVYYAQWHNAHGSSHETEWIPNAYPRAYYFLGFINVKLGHYERAEQFLSAGAKLEPNNPKFKLELAKALVSRGQPLDSLKLYLEVVSGGLGPTVSPRDVAMAYRGCGFALIELGRLDDARDAYTKSLEFDGASKLAAAQLEYIDSLCRGATPGRATTVQAEPHDLTRCRSCGASGRAGTMEGLTFVCEQCGQRAKKPWWAFWRAR